MKDKKGSTNQSQEQSKIELISYSVLIAVAEAMYLHISWVSDCPVDFPLMQMHF